MKKIVNISLLLCLSGLVSSIYYGSNQYSLSISSGNGTAVEHTAWGVHNSAIFSVQSINLVVAETNRNFHSEKDPGSSVTANWTSKQNNVLDQIQYLRNALRVFVSQSVRVLIFPFHSFL